MKASKSISAITFLFLLAFNLNAQRGEFETYPNGLIYSEKTINQLEHIVDSLNLKYKNCELNRTFYSKSQTIGHYFKLEKGDIIQAKKELANQISFESFVKKYPNTEITKNILVVKYKDKDDDKVEFSELDLEHGTGQRIFKKGISKYYDKDQKDTWVFKYSKYDGRSLYGFFFPNSFSSIPLKDKYARMIGYADCLIDTTALKFKEDAKSGRVDLPKNWKRLSFKNKSKLLDKMRSTRVVGQCSQDSSPRYHAINIAMLSAETTNWETFLRAHLDIMNDRFDRMSDGSYAWGNRKTYIRELEELDINVQDLIIGISFRIENPATNHYYGSIRRIGRALSETRFKNEIEDTMISMMEDKELDFFNRSLACFLFRNYNHHIEDKNEKEENIERLKKALKTFPDYLSDQVVFKED